MSYDPYTSTSMADLSDTEAAKKAIIHVLRVSQTKPTVARELSIGTESFSLLTEACARLCGEDLPALRRDISENQQTLLSQS